MDARLGTKLEVFDIKGWPTLVQAVEIRFIELRQLYETTKGDELIPPSYLDQDMLLWRTVRQRQRTNDFRMTQDEVSAVRRIAQWTLDVKKDLCDQPREALPS